MSEVFATESLITCDAAAVLPWLPKRKRGAIHPRTVRGWITAGCRGVMLESAWVGSTPCTSEGALRRFFDAVRDAKLPKRVLTEVQQKRADVKQAHANSQARKILAARGILKPTAK